jgi:hypothetical protein
LFSGGENIRPKISSLYPEIAKKLLTLPVFVTGASYDSGTYYDYATLKYNSAGVQQWVARYNGPANFWDYARALAIDAAGNIYVTGYSSSIPN